jgi:alpha-2-macroglobulin-like protein
MNTMATCEHYQSQLLDHLYDLLEPAEQEDLKKHLDTCPGCQAALARAQAHQRVLARAAKSKFPSVRFQPPEIVPAPEPTEVQPAPRRAWDWGPWVVAASVLLVVGGLGVPGGWFWARQWGQEQVIQVALARQEALAADIHRIRAEHQDRLERGEREVRSTQDRLTAATADTRKRLDEVRSRQVKLIVFGPKTVQPGAPNYFDIQTLNLANQPVTTQLNARVLDQDQHVVFEEKNVQCQGAYRVALPRDLALRPNTELFLEVDAQRDGGPRDQVREKLPLAPPVLVTHLTTDRPMYRPGETVYFRSLTLDRFRLTPASEQLDLQYVVKKPSGEEQLVLQGGTRLLAANGSPVSGPDGKPVQGVGCGAYTIDPAGPGGEYTLIVRETHNRFPAQERKFLVNQYQLPRLNKELEFTRKSYGPGDEVLAACRVARVDGGASVAGQPVLATVNVDGQTYGADGKPSGEPLRLQTDAAGKAAVRFRLPAAIERGDATLSVQFTDGASHEPLVRPIPIVLKKLQVEVYPVGGHLIAGVPNAVYFQARTMLGKPAELRGKVVDDQGNVAVPDVATVNVPDQPALNQGIGSFRGFVPAAGRTYELKIETPAGIEGRYVLPDVRPDGVAMDVPNPVVEADQPIEVVLHSAGKDRPLRVGAYCRGRLMDHQPVEAKSGAAARVRLRPAEDVGGVYRVTVFEERGLDGDRPSLVPVAERLIYRRSAARLDLNVHFDHKQYVPGERVRGSVTAANEKGQPAPAVLMVAVVDKSLLTLADEKTHRGLPTHFLLTSEVRRAEDLEYADFLLGPHPQAPAGLDRLLATQGWRRFAEQDPEKFRREQHDDAERLLLASGLSAARRVDSTQEELRRIQSEAAAERGKLLQEVQQAQQQVAAAQNDPQYQQELQRLEAEAAAARQQQALAQREQDRLRERARTLAVPALGFGVALIAVVNLVVGLFRGLRAGLAYYGLAGACSFILVGGMFLLLEAGGPAAAFNQTGAVVARSEPTSLATAEKDEAREAKALDARAALPAPAAPAPLAPEGAKEAEALRMRTNLGGLAAPRAAAAAPRGEMMGRGGGALRDGLAAPGGLRGFGGGGFGGGGFGGGFGGGRPFGMLGEDRPMAAGGRAFRALRVAPAQQFGLGVQMEREAGQLKRKALAQAAEPIVVREYAHVHTHGPSPEVRSDFVDTVYWQPVLVLPDGKGEFTFELCDSVTTYHLTAYGHTLDGRLGSVTANFEARLPFTVEPALPVEVTASDKLDVPVSLANNTNQPRTVAVRLNPTGMSLVGESSARPLDLPPEGRGRQVFRLQPSLTEGQARLTFEGQSSPFRDTVVREVKVVPDGFPVNGSHSDVLEGVARQEVTLPASWRPGTLRCQVNVYPSTLASLQQGLEGLLREPNGCFEQTSSSSYPNLLVLDYLRESDQARPEVERRARELLARGYQKLVSFECQAPAQPTGREGYEWFGGTAPPHEALTAYGLLQFRDMARVQDVDQAMLQRTRAYLLSRRDGKGGFQRNARAIDTFGRAPEETTNAYIVWALTESGPDDDVSKELSSLHEQAKKSQDAYFLALVANSLLNRGRNDDAVALLRTLAGQQKPDGHVDGARTSITHSGGRDLQIETTALTVLAWLKANRPEFAVNVQNAVKWIGQQRGGHGAFGSTQSTILALKALIAFTRANKKTAEAGEVRLFLGDGRVAELNFPAGAQDVLALNLPEPEKHLKPGKNDLRVEITGKNVFPYTLSWSYRTLTPVSADRAPVRLSRRLDRTEAVEGETVRLTVAVENVSGQGQGMTVAVVGLPAGLTIPEDMKQLKDLARPRNDGAEPGRISFWETRGRELILYWRDMAPGKKVEVPLDLICRVPGEYRGPASRVYLYYNADQKHWIEPLSITIRPKAQ